MKKLIRLTESDLHRIVKESVKRVLREDTYSYNGDDYRNSIYDKYSSEINREEIFKENIKRFKTAYKTLSDEYSVIKSLKRKPSVKYESQSIFSLKNFLKYVIDTEGDMLYEKIWEKYGAEYVELADQYLQNNIIKLKDGTSVSIGK